MVRLARDQERGPVRLSAGCAPTLGTLRHPSPEHDRNRLMKRMLIATAVAAVALAGCGGGESKSSSSSPTTTTTSSTLHHKAHNSAPAY
jgi:hypothetical protein